MCALRYNQQMEPARQPVTFKKPGQAMDRTRLVATAPLSCRGLFCGALVLSPSADGLGEATGRPKKM